MPKSIIINKHGGPDVLEIVDTKIKTPGPKEIRIKTKGKFNKKKRKKRFLWQ